MLWGDFPDCDDNHALDQLKRELSLWDLPLTKQTGSGDTSTARPNAESGSTGSGTIHLGPIHSMGPSLGVEFGFGHTAVSNCQNPTHMLTHSLSSATHIVNVSFSPRYFEVCVNIGNYAIDHHEIGISRVTSDSELFELVWDKYNSSRGIGLRRLFLRPRSIDFVMVSTPMLLLESSPIH